MIRQIYFYKMSSLLLKVDGLSLTTKNGFIVRNLSFDINRGEIIALTGKSGSGKTSIALSLLGVLPKSVELETGTITYYKEDNSTFRYPDNAHEWPFLRGAHIGFIQQDVFGAFNPALKVGKQMLMIIAERTFHKRDNYEKELKSVMTETGLVDIDRIWNSYPHQLSGGQLQRCLLSMSVVMRPSLIIADEPTSAIDKINQVEILDVLAFIRKQYNISILCIAHEAAVVHYLADREIQLEKVPAENRPIAPKFVSSNGERPILKVDHLAYTHHYGGISDKKGAVIKDVTFVLTAGQCLGIIGESGSGKSTVAQMLVGLFIPTEGSVTIEDHTVDFRSVDDIGYLRSRIQLVMQDGKGSLHPNKTIRELLDEVIRHRKKSSTDYNPDLMTSLQEVGLPIHVLDRTASSLSGGECLRVSIARALLLDPDILICDESTSALDEISRNSVLDLFRKLMHVRNLGLIVISHDNEIIRNVAQKAIVFSEGVIVEQGETEKLISNPNHPVTQKIFSAQTVLAGKPIL